MTSTAPLFSRPTVSGLRRTLLGCTLAILMTALIAVPADAASTTPGDFSSVVSTAAKPNPLVYRVDDCTAEVGVVYDWTAYPNYHHVGGVRVNCASRHSVIQATVALYYYNGSRWVQYGSSGYGVRYNQTGSGFGLNGILRTPAYCVGGYRAYWWMVGATVRTERTGLTFYSHYYADTTAGC